MENGTPNSAAAEQAQLIAQLVPLLEQRFSAAVTTIETHISTLLLVGEQAFKIKKPVNFGFLDFSTLERRRHFCEEELRLNGRLAPALYQRVVAIRGSIETPQIDEYAEGRGEAIEYMVQMARFEQQHILQQRLGSDRLSVDSLDQLADRVATFHLSIAKANGDESYVQPQAIGAAVQQNFDQIRPLMQALPEPLQDRVVQLESWSAKRFRELQSLLVERVAQGFVRECHGDLHLGNIALIDGEVTLFDGIEFNEAFRWIDVISDLAFLLMDLLYHGCEGYGDRLLNRYLEATGDYAGLQLLPFYQIYRAMVRTKVGLLRLDQLSGAQERGAMLEEITGYLELAERLMTRHSGGLVITYGVSGSGKSYVSQQLIEAFGVVRIRSDVERIRRFPHKSERYTPQATEQTYQLLHHVAHLVVSSGYTVLLDATYLKLAQRQQAAQVANDVGCKFLILDMQCEQDLLEQRIRQRLKRRSDPSEADIAVLHQQLRQREPLTVDELCHHLAISAETDLHAWLAEWFRGVEGAAEAG